MLLYILDSALRRDSVIDDFESLIWTERMSDLGDFELSVRSTLATRSTFVVGRLLAINKSHRVMEVENVEDNVDDDGKEMLTVKGRSLERILDDRIVKYSGGNLEVSNEWIIEATPANVARTMFNRICRTGALSQHDLIPFLQTGSIFPTGTIPEPTEVITHTQRPESLYRAIKTVCKMYELGFRLVRGPDDSTLYFDVYAGNNRTTQQSNFSPVVFSVQLDNIQNYSEFSNVQETKNVAYVYTDTHAMLIYGPHVATTVSGFERRAMVLTPQVPQDHPNPAAFLVEEGKKALRAARGHSLFDGEVNERSAYIYGVDYEVGDLVEMRNKDGVITHKRVTEQIFVADEQGERSYPTLSLDISDPQNTWLSSANNAETWSHYTTETWADG
jgi:hypothetical protein